jgi:ABC-type multidrug transport system ATPase subunit
MALLQRLNSNGMTIIMVTHSPECAGYAQRVLTVSDGLVLEEKDMSALHITRSGPVDKNPDENRAGTSAI